MDNLRPEIKILENNNFPRPLQFNNEFSFNNTVVSKVDIKGINKIVYLNNGKSFSIPVSTPLVTNDQIIQNNDGMFVVCENGFSKIYPPYNKNDHFVIGSKKHNLTIKQITEEEELEEQKYLSTFHYRNRTTFGGSAKLIALSKENGFPKVIGYIELSIAPLMNKARSQILDSHYDDGKLNWYNWNFDTIGKYSKTIVSISRVVVHPEFRGLGISNILLKHSFKFAKDYWHVKGLKPIFVEIVADMLKFYPFVKKSGMVYAGQTEGNLRRLKKDLKFGLRHRDTIIKKDNRNSLLRMQSHYLKQMIKIVKKNRDEDDIFSLIEKDDRKKLKQKFPLFYGVIRYPKPTYMIGLNEYAKNFLKDRIDGLEIQESVIDKLDLRITPIDKPIKFDNVTISFKTSTKSTEKTEIIKEAFGIFPEQMNSTVLSNFNFEIKPREIILITGLSGSGKTVLLNSIERKIKLTGGKIEYPSNMKLGVLKPLSNQKPLIELIGNSLYESLFFMNKSGLSEARLYLRKFKELSNGQKYRAMIAQLIGSGCNVWVADEFLTSLDFVTANIVASNIRNLVKKLGITLIVASANPDHYINSLRPDKTVVKEFGEKYRILNKL